MEITNIEITPFRPSKGFLGFCTCLINHQFFLGDIAMFSRPTGGIRLGFPVKRLSNGGNIDVFKPLNREVEKVIEEAVTNQYMKLMERDGNGISEQYEQ